MTPRIKQPGTRPGEAIDAIAVRRERLRAMSRQILGVRGAQGDQGEPARLRSIVASSGVGWYPLVALGMLVVVDEFQSYGFAVLGPEISRALGVSPAAIGSLLALKLLAITIGSLPMAAYVQKKARRAAIAIATGFMWSIATMFTGFVANIWGMLFITLADGASSGSVRAVHPPLIMDTYPPQARVRTLTFHRGAIKVGQVAAPLLVALLSAALGFTWRGVFLVSGIVAIAAALVALKLRDPGFGRWDTNLVREAVRDEVGEVAGEDLRAEEVSLGFFEIVRRLMLMPTVRRLLAGYAVMGMWLVPLETFIFFFLEERWNMGPGARGVFFAALSALSIVALVAFGRRGEKMFTDNPVRLIDFGVKMAIVMVVSLALSTFMPVFLLMGLFFAFTFASSAILFPTLSMLLLSIVPSRMRTHAAALSGIALAGIGGMGGLMLLGGIDRRFGVAAAVASLSVPGLIAALVLRSARETINGDLDRMIDDIIEDEELRGMEARGIRMPMLACRHVDFSYGQLQVLFDVSFAVDDGEMVALLGTNGAGKSTLLRVISGLGLPSHGRIHYRGADITYLDAERRLGLGITQVPGGRAVFGSLTVVENLRVFGHLHGGNRAATERGIDATFEAFPALAAHRNQRASTLSGGEQQMLGLGKALIIQPKLLLIDELSLGLAPKIVGELLGMVRRINQAGTAVVLVEQSVNIALSLVEHAYFMEKGGIRFDGPAKELLGRRDLLRSVFLEGATKGLA
jgi:ABC-type branched-subunit amino acid transport system ATPase component/MFS family permease